MSQLTLSLSPRMVSIIGFCLLALCVLLFLLGVEIGKRMAPPLTPTPAVSGTALSLPAHRPNPAASGTGESFPTIPSEQP